MLTKIFFDLLLYTFYTLINPTILTTEFIGCLCLYYHPIYFLAFHHLLVLLLNNLTFKLF